MTHETIDLWILGLNFHQNYYTIYDQENMRMGLAPSKVADPKIATVEKEKEDVKKEISTLASVVTFIIGGFASWMWG